MTRTEIDALIEKLDHESLYEGIEWQVNGTCYLKAFDLGKLIILARLGASVAAPSEAEIEAMARGICQQHADAMGNTWGVTFADYWTNNKAAFVEDARAALASLKDSANV